MEDDVPPQSPPAPDPAPAPEPLALTADMLAPPEAPARIDFERGINHAPLFTLVMIGALIGVFVWQLSTGALDSQAAIVQAGALSRPEVMSGEVWRLVTATFLHGGFDHLLGNCAILYILGMACEHAFGTLRTIAIYAVSGLAGSLLSLGLTQGPAVGASGAIFGLSSAIIVFFYRYHHVFFVRDKRVGFALIVWAVYSVILGFLTPGIDNYAHIGGFTGGAVMGALLPRRDRPELQGAFAILHQNKID
ncbi:MAG TPA: rhomboid family intramembrane serine protease [Tepidisphaeraceae bacterium]|nr:rhomboid family intramembrane serine protease [Tepidisphaeraceae bacterium]